MLIDLELPKPIKWGNTISHWIPNNGEAMEPFKIKITGKDNQGQNYNIPAHLFNINIEAPWDAAFKGTEPDIPYSNIHRNKGTSEIEIIACNVDGEYETLLKSFRLNQVWKVKDRYDQVSAGNFELKINNNGYLTCKNGSKTFNYFSVRLNNNKGIARPGDDFLLRFSLLKDKSISGNVLEGDFLAVYDKNLMDAANMYIHDGVDDWNNFNEKEQVTIKSWRRFNDNALVTNSVAYSWGAWDSVDEFNNEVEELDTKNVTMPETWFGNKFPAFEIKEDEGVNYYIPIAPKHSVPGLSTFSFAAHINSPQSALVNNAPLF